jgi:hypothetical protein
MPTDTNFQENEFAVGLNYSIYVTKHIPKSQACKEDKPTEVCGDSAAQYGKSEKCSISFLFQSGDRTIQ